MSLEKKKAIEIVPLQPSGIGEASMVMSRAFTLSPLLVAALGESNEKQRSTIEKMYRMMLKEKSGTVLSAKEDGKILGVIRFLEWPQCQKENNSFLGLKFLLVLLVFRGKALRLRKWFSIWAKHDPNKPHLHLSALGVLPERQGQGVGSLMLAQLCDYADKLNQAVYLETDVRRNVHLYERFGFAIVEEEPVLSAPNWFMWRPPRLV